MSALNRTYCIALTVFGLAATGAVRAADVDRDVATGINNANALLRSGDVPAALKAYESVQQAAPDRTVLSYDVGVAQYRKGDLAAAERHFSEAASTTSDVLASKARFNLGNCSYAKALRTAETDHAAAIAGFDKAIDSYRSSLELDPTDVDARANIELASAMIDKLRQQDEQQKKQQDQQKTQQQKQKQDQNKSQKDQKDQKQNGQGSDNSQKQDQQRNSEKQNKDQQKSEDKDQSKNDSKQQSGAKDQQQSSANDQKQSGSQDKSSEKQNNQQQNPEQHKDQQSGEQQKQSNDSQSPESKTEDSKSKGSKSQTGEEQKNDSQQNQPKEPQNGSQSSSDEKQTKSSEPSQQNGPQPKDQQTSAHRQANNQRSQQQVAGQPSDPKDSQGNAAPKGTLSTSKQDAGAEKQQQAQPGDAAEATVEGPMTKQEAEKMLQAIRDQEMVRRLGRQQVERNQHIRVDRDW